MANIKVTRKGAGMRDADPNACFYCGKAIGENHDLDCVCVTKRVKLKATITFEVEVPHCWRKGDIEFHRNDGTWCSDNMLEELKAYAKKVGCLCPDTNIKYVETVDDELRLGKEK